MNLDAFLTEMAQWFAENHREMTESEFDKFLRKHGLTDADVKGLLAAKSTKERFKKALLDLRTARRSFVKVGDRVRYIDVASDRKFRYGHWPEGVFLGNKQVGGTVTEFHPQQLPFNVGGEHFEAIPAWAGVKWDNGADTAIDAEDEGTRWVRSSVAREDEGKRIAQQLGNGVTYDGPYIVNGKFQMHGFTDVAITGGSFTAQDLEGAKAKFIALRRRFGEPLPEFGSYLVENERVLPFANYANGTATWTGVFGGSKITVKVRGLMISQKTLAPTVAIVSNPASHEDMPFSGAGGGDAWWQSSTRERSYVVHVSGISGLTIPQLEAMVANSVASISVGAPSYLIEEEPCQVMSPEYSDLLPLLEGGAAVGSFQIEPEAKGRKIDEIMARLKQGVENITSSAVFREYLITLGKFHNYSFGNIILISIQRPTATRVAGFNVWKDLGRYVRAGEKGIAILAPCMPRRQTIKRATEEGEEEEVEIQPVPHYFKVVYVFDVSQTEGRPLPEVPVRVLTGAANEELFGRILALDQAQGLDVSFQVRPDQNPEIKGFYIGKTIWVRPEESRAQQLKTLIHENAHYFTESVFMIPRADAETIAESVAFTVGAHFGFDSGQYSFGYVATWAQDKKVLDRNLLNIRKISDKMIDMIEATA